MHTSPQLRNQWLCYLRTAKRPRLFNWSYVSILYCNQESMFLMNSRRKYWKVEGKDYTSRFLIYLITNKYFLYCFEKCVLLRVNYTINIFTVPVYCCSFSCLHCTISTIASILWQNGNAYRRDSERKNISTHSFHWTLKWRCRITARRSLTFIRNIFQMPVIITWHSTFTRKCQSYRPDFRISRTTLSNWSSFRRWSFPFKSVNTRSNETAINFIRMGRVSDCISWSRSELNRHEIELNSSIV